MTESPNLNVVLNSDTPLGFYLMQILNMRGEDVVGVLTNEGEIIEELLYPNGVYFTKELFFSHDYIQENEQFIKQIYVLFNNPTALQRGESHYQKLMEEAYELEKPMTCFISSRIFGGQKMSKRPISEADQFKPDTLRGVDETWIATYTQMRAKYDRHDIRTIIHPTMISPLDLIATDRASDYEMVQIILNFLNYFNSGEEFPINQKLLPNIFDIVHPFDVARGSIYLAESSEKGIFMPSSYEYPYSLANILKSISASLIGMEEMIESLNDIPVVLDKSGKYDIYPTNFNGEKFMQYTQYQPMYDVFSILRDFVNGVLYSQTKVDYRDKVLDNITKTTRRNSLINN